MTLLARGAVGVGAVALAIGVMSTLTAGAAAPGSAPGPSAETAAEVPTGFAAGTASPAGVSRSAVTLGRAEARPSRSAAQRRLVRQAAFATFTLRSERTRDMRGIERSMYRGRFYHRATEAIRLCVIRRESLGYYDVVSPSGSYFGAYQVSRPLARGVTWMMLKEHRVLLGRERARQVLTRLRHQPMNTWPRYWQDAAFFTVMNWEGLHSGRRHWAGGRVHC